MTTGKEQPGPPRGEKGKSIVPPREAYAPADWEPSDATALQALAAGNASAAQQRTALVWIRQYACRVEDLSYRPGGLEGDRDTAFAEGRRFVGKQIDKLLSLNLETFRKRT